MSYKYVSFCFYSLRSLSVKFGVDDNSSFIAQEFRYLSQFKVLGELRITVSDEFGHGFTREEEDAFEEMDRSLIVKAEEGMFPHYLHPIAAVVLILCIQLLSLRMRSAC